MSLRSVLAIIAVYVSAAAIQAAGQTLVESLDSLVVADDIEGYWELTAGGAVIEFRRQPGRDGAYDILMVDSPDYTIERGTPLGSMNATAVPGKYDVELTSDPRRSVSGRSRRFIFDISGGRLSMSAYKVGKTVRIHRLIPYLFRLGIRDVDTRPEGIDGAVRIAPPVPPVLVL